MTTDLKRMLQRRGLKAELPDPASIRDGEIFLALDTNEMFFANNRQYIKVSGGGNVVDALDSTSTTDALSANQGRELDTRISNVNTYWTQYTTNMVNDINKKQDIVIHKGTAPPTDKSMLFYDTSI